MKDKIAFWGTNEDNKPILVILRLRAADNRVDIWSCPKDSLAKDIADKIISDWPSIKVEEIANTAIHIEQDMNQPSLLPDSIKTANTDLVNQTEKEWFVRVLSYKLAQKLEEETEQLHEQVTSAEQYDQDLWDTCKAYWDKVNKYFQERDLTKDQARKLRDFIDKSFDHLKTLRKSENSAALEASKEKAEALISQINNLVADLNPKTRLNDLFDQLKKLQNDSKSLQLPQKLYKKLRETFNSAFEKVKDERKKSNNNRAANRIRGLKEVIRKMEHSIRRDDQELDFQNSRLGSNAGQLEAQLREAKIQMVETRRSSKMKKLEDMQQTLKDLEKRAASFQKEDSQKAKKEKKSSKMIKEKPLIDNVIKEEKSETNKNSDSESTSDLDIKK